MIDLENKTVLVTGAGGSIGSQLCREILKSNVKILKAFDTSEYNLHKLGQELESSKIRLLVGDVRDRDRLSRAIRGTDLIIHAAALKHVKICEYNPDEAFKTNVQGSQNVVDLARFHDVKKSILISTDKAANPSSVMGTTKLLAEKMFLNAPSIQGNDAKFYVVRFGNVFGSKGSVVEIFHDLLRKNGPLSLTDKDVCRYFMSIEQACKLILTTLEISEGNETFILKMKKAKILDVANRICYFMKGNENFEWYETGLSPGEKLDEILMSDQEKMLCSETENFYIINNGRNAPHYNDTLNLEKKNKYELDDFYMSNQEIDDMILDWSRSQNLEDKS
ncbi:MAG: hypothetical protein CMB80_17870 [Flammeovirgaceae bacterium]|nr:hypothetical protein [Flammeovirgaceae bacterium]|tara:strand:- start:41 stop:1045 length:1005 start_codon:yes stop_codon:yes gene_type:complete